VFVHVKAFANSNRRPVGNEIVAYEVSADERGRLRAEHVQFVDDRRWFESVNITETVFLAPAALFVGFVAALVLAGRLPAIVLGLYVGASFAAIAVYARDKLAAQNNRWRTPEAYLLTLGLIGGWPGAWVAQRLFRHKSRKKSFQIAFWVSVTVNLGVLFWLLSSQGAGVLRSIVDATQ